MRVNIRYKVYPNDRDALPRDPAWHISTRFRNVGTVGTRSRAIRGSTSDGRVGCSASEGRYAPARPALQGVACLAPSFAISAMRARECRLYLALSIIAPSVNVLGRTRRKPSTIRGAAPDVVIGQSTAAPAGARPYHRGGKRFAWLSYVDAHGRCMSRPEKQSHFPRRRYANTPTRRPGSP